MKDTPADTREPRTDASTRETCTDTKNIKELWIIDGYSLIYSAYWALSRNPMLDPEGKNVSCIVLFLNTLLALEGGKADKSIIIALDSAGKTFRHDIYADYKANRPPTPEDLRPQLPRLVEILKAMQLPILRDDMLEADDLIASAVEHFHAQGRDIHVLTKDKDLMQLVRSGVLMHRPTSGSGNFELFDTDAVYAKMGVWPQQVLDYLALVGDSSDNIPGVTGIGPKSASSLLGLYGNLDGIYEHIDELKPAQKKKLAAGKDSAYLSRRLAQLKHDVPIAVEETDIAWAATLDFVDGLGARALRSRIERIVSSGTSRSIAQRTATSIPTAADSDTAAGSANSVASTEPDTRLPYEKLGFPKSWGEKGTCALFFDLERFSAYIDERLAGENPVLVLDLETTGLRSLEEDILGIAAAPVSGSPAEREALDESKTGPAMEGAYLIVKGVDENRVGCPRDEKLRAYMQSLFDRKDLTIVGQNFNYDAKVFHHFGVKARWDFDTMIASWVLSATPRYNMDLMAEYFFGYSTIHFKDMTGGLPLQEVDPQAVGDYAAEDAYITYRMYRLLARMLEAEPTQQKRFYEIEMPTAAVLNKMETRGIGFDTEALDDCLGPVIKRHQDVEEALHLLLGEDINLNSPQQLQQVLFEVRGLPKPRSKGSTGYSTSRAVLESLAKRCDDPAVPLLLEYRVLQKLKSGYIDALPALVYQETGRIHTNYLIIGTDTGRLSSIDPNLQNIPIKTDEGRRIRSCFIPEAGYSFLSVDYSQIELVVLAHLSGDPALQDAFVRGVDVHNYTAGLLFDKDPSEVTSDERRIAKTVNFGVVYGQSAYTLANTLGLSNEEAKHFIAAYFSRYAKVRALFSEIISDAREKGYVETMCGRRRMTPDLEHSNFRIRSGAERAAINSMIQGSAADIMKLAMLRLDAWAETQGDDCRMLLQVHDELLFELKTDRAEELMQEIKAIMEHAYSLDVPLRCSAELGASWGDLH